MGKIVNLKTAQSVAEKFLESIKKPSPETFPEISAVKTRSVKPEKKKMKLNLVHQALSLTEFSAKSKSQPKMRAEKTTVKKDEKPCFYIFNSDDKKFVIVSAEENFTPVIGYSDSGNFDSSNIPPAMEAYLENTRLAILKARNRKASAKKIAAKWKELKSTKKANNKLKDDSGDGSAGNKAGTPLIAPLIKTRWAQSLPYNKFCPPGCPTGCVATAMAQIMNYYGFPDTGKGSHTSSKKENGVKPSANFQQTRYRWDLMTRQPSDSDPEEEVNAVAVLMRHCGISVDMEYTSNGSFANMKDAKNSLKKHFRYSKNIAGPQKSISIKTAKDELRRSRPIFSSGFSKKKDNNGKPKKVGHAFICDGYDSNDYFHFNWGWGGFADGYFLLANPNSYEKNKAIVYKVEPGASWHIINVSDNYGINNAHRPVIYPYGNVPVVKGYTRTFTIDKNNIGGNYLFESVTINGAAWSISFSGNKAKFTASASNNLVRIVVQLRQKKNFAANDIVYSPIAVDYKNAEIAAGSSGDKIIIAETVKDAGDTEYNVIGIGKNAFLNQKRLISIKTGGRVKYIGKSAFEGCLKLKYINMNVSRIEERAFAGCSSLKRIISYSPVPPSCTKNAFQGLYKTLNGRTSLSHIKLYVYDIYAEKYRKADIWKDFTIVPIRKERTRYYLATFLDRNGEHEVHKASCKEKSDKSYNLIDLGIFNYSIDAIRKADEEAARRKYSRVDGCYYCCYEEHSM